MCKVLVPLTILFLLNSFHLNAQKEKIAEYESTTVVKELENREGETYKLLITLPPNYNDQERYKVLYYLDAWWLSDLVKGSYEINFIANNIEKVILVGILSPGTEEEWNKQRNKDYTPSFYDLEMMKVEMKTGNIELNDSTTGGADDFTVFLKSEVFNFVESEYNIDRETRGFLGHSFGGLFGYYSLVNHNGIFRDYILLSPSIWWNKSELLTEENIMRINHNANIFIAFGSDETTFLKEPIRNLTETLRHKSNVSIVMKEYGGVDHHSILPSGIYDGIKELYSKGRN